MVNLYLELQLLTEDFWIFSLGQIETNSNWQMPPDSRQKSKQKLVKKMDYSSMRLCHELLSNMGHKYEYALFQRVKD